ncbi:lipoprotein insertase outer membrane protein LolB [Candidatus Erwinia haradaeae]|uniref:lipoprotein insertase outer membrane protein LolB n=1 Tax=Candidatus Erwinia haradaeae TaxID=1922217 RepID=UPI0013003A53|nr:lipoprotein insertase outer membrane protein LolB [Candidatus Erwinia haradaeae]
MYYHFFGIIFFLEILLSSCTFHEPVKKYGLTNMSPEWHKHQKLIQSITQYQIRGVLCWFSDDKKGSAHFNWYQKSPDHYRLLLTNPLGVTIFQINQEDKSTYLICKLSGCPIHGDEGNMIFKITGMNIPLENFHQWIMGLPGNGTTFSIDEQSHLNEVIFNNNGHYCRILLLEYRSRNNLPPMPSRIELHQGHKHIMLYVDG